MKTFNVYLTFAGNCGEAMNFYKDCFGGELNMSTFGESPVPTPEGYESKIMHSNLKNDTMLIMASDTMPGQPVTAGNNITLSIECSDEAEEERLFSKLSEGGQVIMPLADQFWGAKFGMLTDQFGLPWMLNYTKNPQ